jgi:hypothetical protein
VSRTARVQYFFSPIENIGPIIIYYDIIETFIGGGQLRFFLPKIFGVSSYITLVSKLGLAISDKKLFRGRRNRRKNWFVPAEFQLFRGTENSRNSVPNHSAEEKNTRNFVTWNKNRSKLSEFCSEPFRGTENSRNSVPNRSAEEKNARNSVPWEKKKKKNSRNSVPKHVSDQNKLSILFAEAGYFVKLIFLFRFLPFRASDSSVNFGMPRNELFLPRNNGSHSESIPRNFFGTKFLCQP